MKPTRSRKKPAEDSSLPMKSLLNHSSAFRAMHSTVHWKEISIGQWLQAVPNDLQWASKRTRCKVPLTDYINGVLSAVLLCRHRKHNAQRDQPAGPRHNAVDHSDWPSDHGGNGHDEAEPE